MEGIEPLGKWSEVHLEPGPNDVLKIGTVKLYPNKVTFDSKTTLEDARIAGIYIQRQSRSANWTLGDWALATQAKFGEEASQYVDSTHFTEEILKSAMWVCSKVDPARRVAQLSFEHHKAIAKLDPKQQDKWLRRAAEKGWSVIDLRRNMRQKEHKDRYIEKDLPEGRYRVIYVDFPWKFDDNGFTNDQDAYNKAERHYPPMTDDEVLQFAQKIKELQARDSVLALWVPVPRLPFGLEVMQECGFIYKTEFVWRKFNPQTGNTQNTASHYSGLIHEVLLIGTHGSMVPEMDVAHKYESVQSYPRPVGDDGSQVHSRKPDEFRQMLDEMYPKVTKTRKDRIEFFARYVADGWDQFGNEQLQDGKAAAANDRDDDPNLNADLGAALVEAEEATKIVATPEGPARLVKGNRKRTPAPKATPEPAAATA